MERNFGLKLRTPLLVAALRSKFKEKKVALFILFNDPPCFPESTIPRKKFEKNIWYPKIAKNDRKFSLKIQSTIRRIVLKHQ